MAEVGVHPSAEAVRTAGEAEAEGAAEPAAWRARYVRRELLGQGTYGKVWRADDRKTGRVVALKRMKLDSSSEDGGLPATSLREVALLRELHHDNIVQCVLLPLLGALPLPSGPRIALVAIACW